jgi:hypothetical protein
MPGKYNIALVPTEENADPFVKYSTTMFSVKAAEYSLGVNSKAHVTLCHFEAEEKEINDIVTKVRALNQPAVQLTFSTQRSKTYPTHLVWGQWSWVSLISDKLDELKKLHLRVAEIVRPTNAAFDAYDPHMTLFNSYDKEQCAAINQSQQLGTPLTGKFEIILGSLDDVGQVTEILYNCTATSLLSAALNNATILSNIGINSARSLKEENTSAISIASPGLK